MSDGGWHAIDSSNGRLGTTLSKSFVYGPLMRPHLHIIRNRTFLWPNFNLISKNINEYENENHFLLLNMCLPNEKCHVNEVLLWFFFPLECLTATRNFASLFKNREMSATSAAWPTPWGRAPFQTGGHSQIVTVTPFV